MKTDRLYAAIEYIFERVYNWCRNNKAKFIIILLFEVWLHSFMFDHLGEFKKLTDLIPFHEYFLGE